MDAGPFLSARHAAHDLTKAEGFVLGPLAVDPPSRRVSAGERSEMIEPRVMRVLVALGEADGKVLSRDDLIELCWDGTIVGDNAINRVISQLRHVLADLGGDAVRLETITKVGFRLVCDPPSPGAEPQGSMQSGAGVPVWQRAWTRRAAAVGLAGATAAFAYAAWLRPARHVPDPRAVELYRRGQAIQKAGEPETMGDAIKLYKQALAIDPRYADAWAGIAIGQLYRSFGHFLRLSDPHEVRTAAGRALALDPDNADARLALIANYPLFRRWLDREARLRAFVADHPDSALGNVLLCLMVFDAGRLDDAQAAARRAVEIEPEQKFGWIMQVWALTYAGRHHEADLAFEEARKRWPRDPRLWLFGSLHLSQSKRYAEAVAYLRDTTRRPAGIPVALLDSVIRQTEALATGRGIDEVRNTARNTSAAGQIENLHVTVPMFVDMGMIDEVFALFEAYFFGGMVNGTRIAPPGPLDQRPSRPLFAPAVLSLRGDPRYASLLERTGLEEYWRKSGTRPDFRRG